ncbi:chemotaxis response regulator protein-glutamate methylesterase [Gloeothece verrucosa]|uniref:Protein-glutamate methylesterase/protein-glutamine glutaminase n=1 Tax=Gloeothece verrucosa (strain PCC 7822) TaxID=497965 RepID=E0U5L8_GLOV7|nr:chemotaxis response regulator protein-glutamate methylesterase [Gloeothece verrucosa]ADN14731.1 response regulator receiver modulated CheB methylesterase [Gloeothece verrucosa PCC 7822]
MRIAIVNDTAKIVESLRRVIAKVPDYQVAWVARDGRQGINQCITDPPDVILMAVLMPHLDGAKTTQEIMIKSPCAILMITENLKRDSAKIFEAMGYGALDVVHLPMLGTEVEPEMTEILLDKIAMIGTLTGVNKKRRRYLPPHRSLSLTSVPLLVVIGASTGGPKALACILSHLPANLPAAIIIIQHLERQFVPNFVEWLDHQTPLTVLEAGEGSRPEMGKVLLAGTNDHLLLLPDLTVTYTKEPQNYPYRPSVDVFFKSVAQHVQGKGIAILLTGMGKDGAQGLSQLRSLGWHTIAQDQKTSVVYGMPKAAVQLNAATHVLPIDEIAPMITKLTQVWNSFGTAYP